MPDSCCAIGYAAVMAPEKDCRGARAVKVPTVSDVQESLQTMPIVCLSYYLKRLERKRKSRGCYEVPTVHENLGADEGD